MDDTWSIYVNTSSNKHHHMCNLDRQQTMILCRKKERESWFVDLLATHAEGKLKSTYFFQLSPIIEYRAKYHSKRTPSPAPPRLPLLLSIRRRQKALYFRHFSFCDFVVCTTNRFWAYMHHHMYQQRGVLLTIFSSGEPAPLFHAAARNFSRAC